MNQAASPLVDLVQFVPANVARLPFSQQLIPSIAKDASLIREIETAVHKVPTRHTLFCADSCQFDSLPPKSVHLVVTSPPYWTLKEYDEVEGQLGYVTDYEDFLRQLDCVWRSCFHALVPGGRLVCVVGDVCLSRKKNAGIHTVVPLHASIQEHCRAIGFTNLSPIIWNKIANAVYEASGNGGGFLGKPYEPNAVIKNDIEFILMERKPGGYRTPTVPERLLSVISETAHKTWFQQIWTGVTGASTRNHPAPYPEELAERLVRMFSFVGDTVLDPFVGTGTTMIAAARWGRNSIGIEVSEEYAHMAPIAYSAWEGNFKVVMSLCLRRLHDSSAAATTYKSKASALWYLKSPDYQSFRTKLSNSHGSTFEEIDKVGKGLYQTTSDLLNSLPVWLSSPLQTPVGGHDKLVMTFSNVNPDVVKVNAEAIDLDLTKVELGRLHQLVQQRNEIGHGGLFTPPGEKELGEVIKYTCDLIKSFNRAALRWLRKN